MALLTVTNVVQGNSAQFVAEFTDVNGNITTPSGATLNITYPIGLVTSSSNPTTASTAISMTQTAQFFTATWSSSVSSLGLAQWNITALGNPVTQAQGTLRIIQP